MWMIGVFAKASIHDLDGALETLPHLTGDPIGLRS
jgi:hypothetical protein